MRKIYKKGNLQNKFILAHQLPLHYVTALNLNMSEIKKKKKPGTVKVE